MANKSIRLVTFNEMGIGGGSELGKAAVGKPFLMLVNSIVCSFLGIKAIAFSLNLLGAGKDKKLSIQTVARISIANDLVFLLAFAIGSCNYS
jgi:hypothetical protein